MIQTARAQLWAILEHRGRSEPLKIAVSDDTGQSTYSDLLREARQWSGWFEESGLERGDRLLVSAVPCRSFVALLFGAIHAGVVVVPVSTSASPRELVQFADDCAPTLIILHDAITPAVTARHGVVISWEDAKKKSIGNRKTRDSEVLEDDDDPPAFLIYTSGSTGLPKGVVCDPAQVVFSLDAISKRLWYLPTDIVYCVLPLSFDYGLYQVFLCVAAGAHLILDEIRTKPLSVRKLGKVAATILPAVPSMLRVLVEASRRGFEQPSLRLITNTGEALSPQLQRHLAQLFPEATFALMYGLTECKRASIGLFKASDLPTASVGSPLDGTWVGAVEGTGMQLPPGAVGELAVVGPNVVSGYWGGIPLPTATGQDGQMMLLTGDRGLVADDGTVRVLGRIDNQLKIRGVRVYGSEIEEAVLDIPEVTAAILQKSSANQPVLWIQSELPESVIHEGLSIRLDRAKWPARIEVRKALPLTANGKLQRMPVEDSAALKVGEQNADGSC